MRATVVLLTILVSGCAWQSNVMQLNKSSFQVSANASPARGGITGAREMALNKANRFCASIGKAIQVTNIQTGHAFPANGVATVTFLCK